MRIVVVVGARPNFVKIAPLMRELRRYSAIMPLLVHTGQHYDDAMSEQFFRDLCIDAPDVNLGVGSGTHAVQTAEVMRGLEPLLLDSRPDGVLVVGDVNSTLAATLTSVKLGIPVAHVEAGLRSFDRSMPEEINRLLTDAVAEVLFVTEESARQNLLREGVARRQISFVGNVMIDALEMSRALWETSPVFERIGLNPDRPYAVVTLHRPSNVDRMESLLAFLSAFRELARHLPVVFPIHPRVRPQLIRQGAVRALDRLLALDPLGYLDFIALESRARLVLTDSGGVQDETTALAVPCLTLRENTERPVTVTRGTNRVIGCNPARIVPEAVRTLCADRPAPDQRPPLWDGRAAVRIVRILLHRWSPEDAGERRPSDHEVNFAPAMGDSLGAPSQRRPQEVTDGLIHRH